MRESSPTPAAVPAWSAAATIEHLGGDEQLARELVCLFLGSCPRLVDGIRDRMRHGDLTGASRAAHALKGALANFTPEAPTTTAFELERLCALGQREPAAETLRRLEHEVSQLVVEMTAFQQGLS